MRQLMRILRKCPKSFRQDCRWCAGGVCHQRGMFADVYIFMRCYLKTEIFKTHCRNVFLSKRLSHLLLLYYFMYFAFVYFFYKILLYH